MDAETKQFLTEQFASFRKEMNARFDNVDQRFDEASAERELMWGVLVENTRHQHRMLKEARKAASKDAPTTAPGKKRRKARGGRSASAVPLAAKDG